MKEKNASKGKSSSSSPGKWSKITSSSTAEYFSKNLQQVGFSSLTKSVLTTLKEAMDNALDACEDHNILPELWVEIEKTGSGSHKGADQIRVKVQDNGPGIPADNVTQVFGEYLASSKFGRGRCSRGQQGIGISAATTWAQLTSATGARIITKTSQMRKALSAVVEVDIKNNKGVLKEKDTIDWDRPHGTSVEFTFDGRVQLNGEAGLVNYLMGNVLVNPHMTLHYKLPDSEKVETVERVSNEVPVIPEPTEPHPHTMKLGEFIAHSHLFGRVKVDQWLKKGFSRVGESVLAELTKEGGLSKSTLSRTVDSLNEADFKEIFTSLQKVQLKAPATSSVLAIGEESLAKSILRLGETDFFSVVSRKPTICDFKPIQVEVAVARLKDTAGIDPDEPVQVLRFANRVPLQFDKAGCAIVQSITSVNWKSYGIAQPKNALPRGPYTIAVSVVSPFIKFKNASKETIDSSDELVQEIRLALIQAGQKLSRHIRRESKENELEERLKYIEQFCPILVETLCRITDASDNRKKKAEEGLRKILGRDTKATAEELEEAHVKAEAQLSHQKKLLGDSDEEASMAAPGEELEEVSVEKVEEDEEDAPKKKAPAKKLPKK